MRQTAPLADAADMLSDQLHTRLRVLAEQLGPRIDAVDARFLRHHALEPRVAAALLLVTPGAALRLLARGSTISAFFEQVEYNGRRLAKLNIPPAAIVSALDGYGRLLEGEADLQWVREQLTFCIILTLNNAFYQVREAETKAFYELFRIELESRSLDDLLIRFLGTLAAFCGADRARVFLRESDESWSLRGELARGRVITRRLTRIPCTPRLRAELSDLTLETPIDAGWLPRSAARKTRTIWSVPLGGPVASGVMQFGFPTAYEWLPREQELLSAAAERCWMSIEKARLVEGLAAREAQIRELASHMLQVEEAERRRISRELHDESGQSLLCVRLQMEMIEHSLPADMESTRERLRETREAVERTIVETRRLISALSPAVLEQLGLAAAVRQLVQRFRTLHSLKVRLHLSPLHDVPRPTASIVYRLVQECCNNIAKHSFADTVNLSISAADGILKLTVVDNGVGFDVDEAFRKAESFGLSGIRERVALLGGKFAIRSQRPVGRRGARVREEAGQRTAGGRQGTRIEVELPIPREAGSPSAHPGRDKDDPTVVAPGSVNRSASPSGGGRSRAVAKQRRP